MDKKTIDDTVNDQCEAWQCDACGAEVSFDDTTCPGCGADISKVNESKSESSEFETEGRYKGVAGWLKFFCVVLMLNPLFTLVALINEFESIKKIPWFFWTYLNLRIPVILGIIFSVGLAAFSVYAGHALFCADRQESRHARKSAPFSRPDFQVGSNRVGVCAAQLRTTRFTRQN